MKVALVYDRVNKWGGAERVLLALKKIFPNADLFTSVYSKENAPWANKFNVKTSFLQNFPLAKNHHDLYAFLMPIAFESFNFDNYELVISVTSEFAKGIITKPKTLHICYLLTPTRYLWSGYDDYFRNKILKLISKPAVAYLRNWDRIAAKRPDKIITISSEVANRTEKYYKEKSQIIFPPIFISDNKEKPSKDKHQEYFLIVSRLVYYKRIDIAIKAFNKLGLPLKIVGTGKLKGFLKRISNKNIEFLDSLTDKQLRTYYKNCKALIFPGIEDFGLVMAEAQSFGKPVIAFKAGGALDIIKEGITGEFFSEQNEKSLMEAVEKFNSKIYNSSLCIENAQKFSFDNFRKKFLEIIN
jgi:glycosyltransferase involved in cell wall biosynthesis